MSLFLTVKENYAPAHKLIAQIYERSSVYEDVKKAISHYKQSYELDESQKQLTLKSKSQNHDSDMFTIALLLKIEYK